MATTTQPVATEAAKQLINYQAEAGVAVIEMNDPPANTYTYEMNRQLDDAILKARMDNDVYVMVLTGAGWCRPWPARARGRERKVAPGIAYIERSF